jgi:DMSO/TMAO reductase YedYZ molybdopterin-dependent catalytic subunit
VETSASFIRVSSYGGYSANLPLEDLTDHKAWIAYRYDGQELGAKHGGPALVTLRAITTAHCVSGKSLANGDCQHSAAGRWC